MLQYLHGDKIGEREYSKREHSKVKISEATVQETITVKHVAKEVGAEAWKNKWLLNGFIITIDK